MDFLRQCRCLVALSMAVCSSNIIAANPTAAQIEMFKNLPASQQQALAKQYGIELPNTGMESTEFESPTLMADRPQESDTPNNEKTQKEDVDGNGLERFGMKLFAASPSTFAPTSDAPVPADYLVGPGDEINIQLFGKENQNYQLRVSRSGAIDFPNLGPISVAGQTFENVKHNILRRVKEQMIGVRANVSMGELRSIQISVAGDAYKPGVYTVSAFTTISQAIYYSGGFAQSGSLRDIQLKRNGQLIETLDLYNLLLKGDSQHDVRLQPGDVVFVGAVSKTVAISGEVNRPAIYEIHGNESLEDVIAMAGGLTANAYRDKVIIKRHSNNGLSEVISANLVQNDKRIAIASGDDITIAARSGALTDYVKVEGDVRNGGFSAWHDGMRVSDLFSNLEAALNETVDVNYALVVRDINVQHDIKVLQFNLAKALLNPESEDNLELQPRDKVLVFNRFSGRDLKLVDESENEVKSFEQAQANAQRISGEQRRERNNQDVDITKSEKLATRTVEGDAPNQSNNEHTRQELLAPVLMKLTEQATFGLPPLIAEVSGEVKHPGFYPIAANFKVKDLLIAAGGLTADAYPFNAELSSRVVSGERVSTDIININLLDALVESPANNVMIQPRQRLNVLVQPNIKQERSITLQGEVRFPGTYTLRDGETLADIIVRAGGLTELAHPQGAVFTREALRLKEQKLLDQYAEELRKATAQKSFRADSNFSSTITNPEQTLAFVEEASKSKALGRMVVQLGRVLNHDPAANFLLEDGDFLYVPKFRNTVSIMGEVQVAITYLLDNRLDVEDYIKRAGGMKKQADEDRVFVVRADGSVFKPDSDYWLFHSNEALRPGDTIVVPLDTNYRDQLSFWSTATQILYQTGVAINALK